MRNPQSNTHKKRISLHAESLEPRRMLAAGDALSSSVNVADGGVGSNHDRFTQNFGSLAALSNGSFVTSWETSFNNNLTPPSADGDDYAALFQIIEQDGDKVVGPIVPYLGLNPSGTGRQQLPRVAALTGGGFAITWTSADGPGDDYQGVGRGGDVYARVYNDSGTAVSSATRVNEATADNEQPLMILPLTGGGFAVVYVDRSALANSKYDLFVRAYGADGTASGASVRLGGSGHDNFIMEFQDAVPLSNGGFAVAWRTQRDGTTASPDGDDDGVFVQVFDASGGTVAVAQTPYADINSGGTGVQGALKLATLSDGGFAAMWSSRLGPGDVHDGGGDTYTRVFDNDGSPVSATLKVNTSASDSEQPIAIAPLSNGGYAIVYRNANSLADHKPDFLIRTFTSTGTAASSASIIGGPTHEPFFKQFGDIVGLANGNVAVTWFAYNDGATSPDGDGWGAFVEVLSPTGSTVASAFSPYADINSGGTGRQSAPRLTSLPNGGFAVTWNSAGGPGDVYLSGGGGGDTYTRVFDDSGSALHATVKVNESEPSGTDDVQLPKAITSAANGNYAVVYVDENEETGFSPDLYIRAFEGVPPNASATATGVPSDLTVTEDTASNLDLSAVVLDDAEDNALTLTLTLSTGQFGMPADGAGNSVVETRVSATSVTLAGSAANINTYLDTPSNLQYTSAANVSGQDAATLTLTADDGNSIANLGSVNIDITAVNDPPTISDVPGNLTFVEDTRGDFVLSSVSVADVDGDALTLTITASAGSLQATSSGGVVVGGNDTATLTLDGTAAAINTYLGTTTNITYAGGADRTGVAVDTFTVQVQDPDGANNSGNGQLDITPVNDAPRAAQLPTTVTVDAGTPSNFDLSTVTIEDPELDNVIVQLAVSSGTLAASNGTGVTVTLTNNNFLQLAGSPTDINNYLDDASQIQYTSAGPGNALFVMLLSDGTDTSVGGSGTINSTPPPARIDLAVTSRLNTEVAGATDSIVWNVEVTNEAGGAVNAAATGVDVAIRLPPKLEMRSNVATNGTLQGNTWMLSEPLAPGASAVLTLVLAKPADETVTAGNTVAPMAFVAAADQIDTDSTPGNQLTSEDDLDSSSATWVAPIAAPDATSSPSTALPTVRRDGNLVHAVATHGNDVVIVEMGATTHRLEISGHVFEFDATVVDTIYVGGSLGEDYVRVIGTDQNDSGSFFGPRGELISSAYTVKTFSFKETHLIGGGGQDAVRMYGSDDVDTLTVQSGMTQMVTPDHTFYADADRVDVYGRRGADVATLYGSRHADSFLALPDQDHFRSAGKLHVTKGFQVVDVHGAGGADRADLRDTSGDDVFQVTPELAAMRVSQRIRNVHHYDHVTATAQNGGTDTATMAGQTGRRDTLLATPASVRLAGRSYGSRTATGFGQVTATSDDSLDRATFNQLQATDTFFGRQDLARIERGTDRQIVDGFATLTVEIANGQAQPNKDLDDLDFVLSNADDWA